MYALRLHGIGDVRPPNKPVPAAKYGEILSCVTAVTICKTDNHIALCAIPTDDKTSFKAATARRKGLTIRVAQAREELKVVIAP